MLYETERLQEWNDFWEQVPGQDYREDFTPETIVVQQALTIESMRELGEALASDLQELARSHIAVGFIITLREKINKNVDQFVDCGYDLQKRARIKRNIKMLSGPFHRFHDALSKYRHRQPIA
ncbi:hypothetical protein [Paenibacillus beijingensis]|uniref:hypothetical protein n=1 Tax=Paenibacillus beijingensis TaxID=1126833 RepID=UPI00130DA225|nr:hypothetical protein [Paenibacillus beijingensis]